MCDLDHECFAAFDERLGETVARRPRVATVDPDGDLVGVRWFVEGVLMSPTISSMVFTGQHELRAVVRDARGAAATAKKVVSCS